MKRTRQLLLDILKTDHLPQTELDLRHKLARHGLKLNKTTVYRQLKRMQDLNLIQPVDFGDGTKRFELNRQNHHHHLVCTNCDTVEDIFVHNDVKHMEQKIAKLKKFQIKTHSLEFFGLCKNCY